jgi:hypothetical protein
MRPEERNMVRGVPKSEFVKCQVTPITKRLIRPPHTPTVYIAGPMRGIEDFNFPAFDEGRDYVKGLLQEYQPISPADVDREAGDCEDLDINNVAEDLFQTCMRRDLEIVANAHAVLLLKGWEESTGANNEVFVANACGVPLWVALYDDGVLYAHVVCDHPLIPPLIGSMEWRDTAFHGYQRQTRVEEEALRHELHVANQTVIALQYQLDQERIKREVDNTLSETSHYLESIIEEADRVVSSDRQSVYGHPFIDFSRTARYWSAYKEVTFTPEDVALMMLFLKLSRLVNSPDHRDTQVDAHGYLKTYELVRQMRTSLEEELVAA